MKIKTKIISSFILISLIIAVAAYSSVIISKRAFEKEIGSSSAILVGETIHRIDRVIYKRMEEWQIRKNTAIFQEQIKKSNEEFDNLDNVQEYINEQDEKWINAKEEEETTPFMQELLNNNLSRSMINILSGYQEKYGYAVFSEVFVTNKYGTIAALTNKTTDYRQDDEEWWKEAKENSLYIGDVVYDESTKNYSMDLAIRINDEQGNFIGVIVSALNINETVEIINEVKELEKKRNFEFKLLSKDGEIIHSTQNFNFLEKVSSNIFSQIRPAHPNQEGYFIGGENDSELIAYAKSLGYSEFKGFGWILTSTYQTKEIFAPIISLRNIIFLITVAVLIMAVLIAYLISHSIIKPINNLRDGIKIVKGGDLDYRITLRTKDEMGELSEFFNGMIESLKRTNLEIRKKVQEQTKDIADKSYDLEKQQSAILNVLEDVEKEKDKTEKEKNKINAILKGIGEGVFVVDNNLRIILFNPVSSMISGFSEKEAVGKKYSQILKFIYEKNGKINDVFIKKALKSGKISNALNHTLLVAKDGEKIPVSISAAPLKYQKENIIGCVIAFRDVTAERNVDRAKTEFVSIASHQLRTPLTGIKWFIELLLKGKAGKINVKQLSFLQQIFESNERMIALVNDLLNVSRLELGTFSIDPKNIDLVAIIEIILDEFTPQIKEKALKVSKNFDKNIGVYHGDPKLLIVIFQNLLSNAVKYTLENGKIDISLKKRKTDIFFTMSDTGIGIPKNQHSQIFKKLFRADNVKESGMGGTGLGLYIAKTIIDNSGGKIWFESPLFKKESKYKGSKFCFTLPLNGMRKKAGTKEIT